MLLTLMMPPALVLTFTYLAVLTLPKVILPPRESPVWTVTPAPAALILPATSEPLWPVSERLTGNTPPVLTIFPTVTLALLPAAPAAAPFTVTPLALTLPTLTVPDKPLALTCTAPVAVRLPSVALNLLLPGKLPPALPMALTTMLPPVAVIAPALMMPP